jgi:hypothetical protein
MIKLVHFLLYFLLILAPFHLYLVNFHADVNYGIVFSFQFEHNVELRTFALHKVNKTVLHIIIIITIIIIIIGRNLDLKHLDACPAVVTSRHCPGGPLPGVVGRQVTGGRCDPVVDRPATPHVTASNCVPLQRP